MINKNNIRQKIDQIDFRLINSQIYDNFISGEDQELIRKLQLNLNRSRICINNLLSENSKCREQVIELN